MSLSAQLHSFFSMGGYAAYVWSAYGIVLLLLSYNLLRPQRQLRRLQRELSEAKSGENE